LHPHTAIDNTDAHAATAARFTATAA